MQTQTTRYRFVIAGLLLLLNFSLGLNVFGIAPVLSTVIDDLGVGRGAAGFLTGASLAVMAAASIPGAYLIGRFGLKRTVTLGWLLSGTMVLAPLADSYGALFALRVALGLSHAVLLPASGALVMQWFKLSQVAMVTGAMLATMTGGLALSLFTTALLADALGWQSALAVQGGVCLAGALAWLVAGRTSEGGKGADPQPIFKQIRQALLAKTTWLIVLADAGPFAQYVALTAWLPTFYHQELGMSLPKAGFITGLLPFVGIFAVLAGGVLPAKLGGRRPFLVTLGFMACLSGFGAFLFSDGLLLYLAIIALGIASWAYLPVLMTLPMELPDASPERVAMVWAVLATAGGIISFISPFAVGVMTDALGTYTPGFTVWAVLALSLVVAGLALPEAGARRTVRGPASEAA